MDPKGILLGNPMNDCICSLIQISLCTARIKKAIAISHSFPALETKLFLFVPFTYCGLELHWFCLVSCTSDLDY